MQKGVLSKEVFTEGLNTLIAFYPNWNLNIDSTYVLKKWYEKFEHMDNERFMYMINNYIKNDKSLPTVAGLLACDTIPRKTKDQIEHEKMLREMQND